MLVGLVERHTRLRPGRRWEGNVEMGVKRVSKKGMNCVSLTQDRDK